MSDQCRKEELTRELMSIKTFMTALKDKELLKVMAIGLQEKVDELRILQGQEVK